MAIATDPLAEYPEPVRRVLSAAQVLARVGDVRDEQELILAVDEYEQWLVYEQERLDIEVGNFFG